MAKAVQRPSTQLKHEDLVDLMNIYASEFNCENLHDRVLVFEVIQQSEEESGNLQDSKAVSETGISDLNTFNGMVVCII